MIRNKEAISHYVAKYITKDFEIVEKGCKRYWSSKNLKLPTVEYNTNATAELIKHITPENFDKINVYENEFCTITTIPSSTPPTTPLQANHTE